MIDEKLCSERHRRIDERLDNCEENIETLTRSDAVNSTEIKNLCKNIGSLTSAIWGLVSTVFVALFGFFVWYVKNKS